MTGKSFFEAFSLGEPVTTPERVRGKLRSKALCSPSQAGQEATPAAGLNVAILFPKRDGF